MRSEVGRFSSVPAAGAQKSGAASVISNAAPADDVSDGGVNIISRILSRAQLASQTLHSPQQRPTYHRVTIDGDDGSADFTKCAEMIARLINSRSRYKGIDKGETENPFSVDSFTGDIRLTHPDTGALTSSVELTWSKGLFSFTGMETTVVSWAQYMKDVKAVYSAIEFGPCLSTSRTRLTTLQEKFQLYSLLNTELEEGYDRVIRGGGVYANCTRVDNAVRLLRSVAAPTLLEFIKVTAIEHPCTPLLVDATGDVVTIRQYLEEQGGVSNPEDLTIEGLGLHPPLYRNKLQQYDVFDKQLNPSGEFGANFMQALLNMYGPDGGDLLAMVIRPELEKREFRQRQCVATELQIPCYGQNEEEMRMLAAWVRRQGFSSFTMNTWTLSIPRTAPPKGPNCLAVTCKTVGDQLHNIFYPMFMATLHPDDPEWADVASFLDSTGSLSIETELMSRQQNFHTEAVDPSAVAYSDGLADAYFFYYVWANLAVLNALRAKYRRNTIRFSPCVTEPSPGFDQLVSSFLLADSVYHARSLERSWVMQYLYMYCRIGVVMAPLCDNAMHKSYFDLSLVKYFKKGLQVSIATYDPLHFHHSSNGLTEEYATLMKLHNLTPMDLSELARNSVLNSGFPPEKKRLWLGDGFRSIGSQGNDMKRSCVCDYRLQFRHECLLHEETVLNLMLTHACKRGTEPMKVSLVPFSKSLQMSNVVQKYRSARSVNYTDRRIVYPRIDIVGGMEHQVHAADAVKTLQQVIALRSKYTTLHVVDVQVEDVFSDTKFDESQWEYNNYYGIFLVSRIGRPPPWPRFIPPVQEFIRDVSLVRQAVMGNSNLRQLAVHRLNLLEHKFLLHRSLNISNEAGKKEEKEWNNRDFFTAHKVDNNVQTDAGMNARTLLEFFVEKALNNGHDVVFEEDNSPVTLRQLLERLEINVARISVDEMNHLVNNNTLIREIFLSTDNYMQGRYFAELTKCTLELYQEDEYCFSENRLVVYGKSGDEWTQLAHWFDRHGMASSQNRWMVNLPRRYRRLRQQGVVRNFGEYLDNIFKPLWEISLHPAKDTKFHYFLAHVSGFDCIDDESKIDVPLSATFPHDWDTDLNPSYNMYLYYFWANIVSLNEFRASRGLGTFSFRPQCGEQGVVDHLIGGFLLANSINHGILLAQNPVLEYMYYLTQIGIATSPLSNTDGASEYLKNPFPLFFHRGLNVSLATNRPLYFHFTREPLIEEYSIAAKLWLFEFNDLSEIARNSVLQSGFPPAWKQKALGSFFYLRSTLGNEVTKSHVSDIRVAYRYEVYHSELNFLDEQLAEGLLMPRAMNLLEYEVAIYEAAMKATPHLRKDKCGTKLEAASHIAAEQCLSIDGGSSNSDSEDSDARGDKKTNLINSMYLSRNHIAHVKSEVEDLERILARTKVVVQQITQQNNIVASTVNRVREKLNAEGFAIQGNITADVVLGALDVAAPVGERDSVGAHKHGDE